MPATAPFWLLFEPAPIFFNGIDCKTASAAASVRVVHCRSVDYLAARVSRPDRRADTREIEIEILESLSLEAIAERFEPVLGAPNDLPLLHLPRCDPPITAGGANWYDGAFEGDIGAWLVERRVASRRTVLLGGDWSYDHDIFYAGCRPLSAQEIELLDRI